MKLLLYKTEIFSIRSAIVEREEHEKVSLLY